MVYVLQDEPDSLFNFQTIISDDSSNAIKRYFTCKLRYNKLQNYANFCAQTFMHCLFIKWNKTFLKSVHLGLKTTADFSDD